MCSKLNEVTIFNFHFKFHFFETKSKIVKFQFQAISDVNALVAAVLANHSTVGNTKI